MYPTLHDNQHWGNLLIAPHPITSFLSMISFCWSLLINFDKGFDISLNSDQYLISIWYQNGKGNRACWILLTPGNRLSTIVLLLGFLTMERVMPKMKKSRWHITIHIRRQKDDLLSVFSLKLKDVNWNKTMQKTGWTNYSSFLVLSGLKKGFRYGRDHWGAVNNHFPVYLAIFGMTSDDTQPTNKTNNLVIQEQA